MVYKLIKVQKFTIQPWEHLKLNEWMYSDVNHLKSISIEWASKHPLKNWAKENSQGHAQINFPFSVFNKESFLRNDKAVSFDKKENNRFSEFSWKPLLKVILIIFVALT